MTKEEYLELYQKFLQGQTTASQNEALDKYTDNFKLLDAEEIDHEKIEGLYRKLQLAIKGSEKRQPMISWWKVSAAATIAVLLSSLLYFNVFFNRGEKQVKIGLTKTRPIVAGSNKATLTLSDGRSIILNNAVDGQIAKENGTEVIKNKQGTLSYHVGVQAPEQIVFNTISIPRGGKYDLELPDGSKVWLNSESKLKFPTAFSGNTREVELEGEGYFEVARNKQKPFYVTANGVKVEVLGTHFNIMAYRDEPQVRTTLLEGRVRLSANGQSVFLSPGQQGTFGTYGLSVSKADIEEEMAWKNGYFIFNKEKLSSIMRKISRWYDVDVELPTGGSDLSYTGAVPRSRNINEVLKVLSLTGTVKFKIEERRIKITN